MYFKCRPGQFILSVVMLLLTLPAFAGGTSGIPWPSKEILGEFHSTVSEARKEHLIRESLKEKYVAGVTYPFDIVYSHSYADVDKDGGYSLYFDYAARINTVQAKQSMGEQTARFNEAKETVDFIRATVYLPDGRQIDTDSANVRVKEPFTDLVYSDLKIKILSVQGLEEGSVLRLLVKRTYRPTIEKGYFVYPVELDARTPAKEKLAILRFKGGGRILEKDRIGPPLPDISRKTVNSGTDTFYIYKVTDIKPRVSEPGSVPVAEFDNRITLYWPATWDAVAKLSTGLYEPKITAGPEVVKRARELTAKLTAGEDRIRAIYEHVQAFRYVAISLNEGDFIPRSADETLKNGYGDCKDKAVLMVAMLRSVGIDSSVALVKTTRLMDNDIPFPFQFDHAIVAVRKENGSYAFLDPTSLSAPYGLLPQYDQYRHALILGDKKTEPILIPAEVPEKNQVEEFIDIGLKDAQTAEITSKSLTVSTDEYFHMLPRIPNDQLLQMLKQGMAKEYKDFEIMSAREELVRANGILKGETTAKIRDFSKRMGSWYVFNPLFDADRLGHENIIALAARTTDIELDGPKRLSAAITIRIPDTVSVEFVPKPFSVKNDKFGSYSYEVSRSPGVLSIRRDVRITARRVSAKDYPEFREFYRACLKQDEEVVGLKDK